MPDRRLPGERLAGEIATAVLRNIDPDEILAGLDINALAGRVDVDALVGRLDLDALIGRVDLDALVDRLDLDALVDRLDVAAIAARVPIERLIGSSELQRAVDQLDLGPALRRAGLADIVANSVGRSTLDTLRRRVVVVDALGERLSGRLLRQQVDTWPAGPVRLVGSETGPLGDLDGTLGDQTGWDVSGHYVGPFGRLLAGAADLAGAIGSWSLITSVMVQLLGQVFGAEVGGSTTAAVVWGIGLTLWLLAWFLLPLEVVARTPAMSLLGMRVVNHDGEAPGFGTVLGRTLAQVPSTLLFGIGYLLPFLDRHRRTLHDVVARTTVVWDWGGREATIASPLGRWVAEDGARQRRTRPLEVDEHPDRAAPLD